MCVCVCVVRCHDTRNMITANSHVQEWVIFLWTLASRTHRPPLDLLHLLHSRLYGGPPWTAEDQQKAWPILLWSLSMLDLYDEDVVSWISNSVSPSNIAELDAQRLATCLFSLAVMPEGVLNRHAALVDKLVAAANRIETQEYGSIGCIQLWQFHLELLATTNSQQLPSTANGSAAATSTAQSCPPRDRNCRTNRRRMTSSDATGPAVFIHTHVPAATTSASTAITTARPQAQSPLAVRRHLSPALVAAARDALLRRNARISSANASSLQLSVYSHLRMIQLNHINQLQAHTAAAAAEQGHQLQPHSQQQPEVKLQRQRQRQQHDEVEQEQQFQQYHHQHQGPKARKRSRSMPDLTSVVDVFSATNATAAAAATTSSTVIGCSFATTSHGAFLNSSGESGDESADAAALAATAARTTFGRWRRERVGESCTNSCSATAAVRILRVEQEWLVEALALRVDLCVWLSDGRQVVVEVDGPSHYFANLPRTQRPKTALRNRQLSRVFGAENVQCVPYWDWEVTAGVEARTAYLSRLLGLLGPE
ncbi:hypothetical protein Vretimale_13934 [Volvox reticuliferus]|uniref:RAP domain-containing protein n=1 Tax=Volvox reticuliferus TaxID=1737510 RepID=A0A8J4GMZ4_9CHLO|nr:hypothetical protein Vretimale_13934 [Volvox reticuliferus]